MLSALEEALEKEPEEVNLFLQGVTIGEVGAVTVLRHMRAHSNLTLLELRGSSIGCKGAEYLASGIPTHMHLRHLGLGRNGLGSKGALHILNALLKQEELRRDSSAAAVPVGVETLDLESNMIQDSVGAPLGELLAKSTSLLALSLEKNDLRMDGAILVAEGLKASKTIRNLNLAQNRCGLGSGSFGEALKVNRSLLTLNLASNGVYPDSAKSIVEALAVNHVLKSVNLQYNQAVDAFSVAGNGNLPTSPKQVAAPAPGYELSSSLRELNLFGNRLQASLSQGFAQTLRTGTGLISLSLGRCSTNGVAMVPVLSSISTLHDLSTLDLVSCGLTPVTAQSLATTMLALPNLGTLLLDENRLEEDGTVIVAQALEGCAALTYLSMDCCGINPKGASEIGKALVNRRGLGLVELHLGTNSIDNESMIPILDALCFHQGAGDANLEVLDLHGNPPLSGRITGTLVKVLELHRNLVTVNIRDTTLCNDTGVSFMGLEDAKYYAAEFSSTANSRPTYVGGSAGGKKGGRSGSPLGGAMRSNFNSTTAAWHEGSPRLTASPAASNATISSYLQSTATLKSSAANDTLPKTSSLTGPRIGQDLPPTTTAAIRHGSTANSPSKALTTVRPKRSEEGEQEFIPGLSPALEIPFSERRHQLHDVSQNIEQFPITEDQLRRQFSLLDRSGDGVLDREEFEEYFKSLKLVDVDLHSFKRTSELVRKYCDEDDRLSFDAFSIVMLRLSNM